jgi:Eco29kI restriction endonuclease
VSRLLNALDAHASAIEVARAEADPIQKPRATFDPGDPKVVARMVSIALLPQPLTPLRDVSPSYGWGYTRSITEEIIRFTTVFRAPKPPIYVGKADPARDDASTTREQGVRLTRRLAEHAVTIATAELYSSSLRRRNGPIELTDFHCGRLVCATNAQLAAERHLIGMFWPLWNSETKTCWGLGKHGDAAKTRKNKQSPWDVVHPGRRWALAKRLVDSLSPDEIRERIKATLKKCPVRRDHAALFKELLDNLRQDDIVRSEPSTPPVGAVSGPDEDEAGDPDA